MVRSYRDNLLIAFDEISRLGGKRGQTDSRLRTADTKRKFSVLSAFSTLVENADTLENTRKTRKKR